MDRGRPFANGRIGEYDFREEGEIAVDVLGHLFEKSITGLEKLRVVGLFGSQDGAAAATPKSAERKRFGIYYTPPDNYLGFGSFPAPAGFVFESALNEISLPASRS